MGPDVYQSKNVATARVLVFKDKFWKNRLFYHLDSIKTKKLEYPSSDTQLTYLLHNQEIYFWQ